MIGWIESHSTPVIALFVFGFCYMFASAICVAAIALSRRPIGQELQTISPVTLTPLAVILGLLIAFLATRVWENAGHARDYVGQEASALSKALLFADALPPEVRAKLRASIKQHIDFVLTRDWPDMANLRANPGSEPHGLTAAINTLLSFSPSQANQQFAQSRAVTAIESAFEARRNRIRLSQRSIASLQWVVIFVLALLILATTAMIHIGKPRAMAATAFIFSTAVAVCLVLLMVNDRPFTAGGITLEPSAFREVVVE